MPTKSKEVEALAASEGAPVAAPPRPETPEPSVERRLAGDVEDIKTVLDSQERVKIRLYQVPKDSTDKPLPDEYVNVNGHGYLIKRGVTVEVPKLVAEVLEHANRI